MSHPNKGTLLSLFSDEESQIPSVGGTKDGDESHGAKQRTRPQALKNISKQPAKRGGSSQKSSIGMTSPLPGQGFLPGLSRRGRPRLAVAISPVERTAEHRRKRIEAGAKRVEIILDKDVSLALDALAEHYKEPRSDVISTLIAKAATKVLKK